MKREYEDYLLDMLKNAEKVLSFVQGMDYDGFAQMIKLCMLSFGPLKLSEKLPAKSRVSTATLPSVPDTYSHQSSLPFIPSSFSTTFPCSSKTITSSLA